MSSSAAKIRRGQPSLPTLCPIADAVDVLSKAGIEARGAIFTKREVVDFILDLTGYTADRPLHKFRLLEPSFGNGDFLLPAIERLLKSWKAAAGRHEDAVSDLGECIRAVELHRETFNKTREKILEIFQESGIPGGAARGLAKQWLVQGDFLLASLPESFDFVVGNPPYVRQEMIPDALIAEYRARYSTIYDRADLYIPFIESSLTSLGPEGQLGFICADRWMKNRYGGPLRELVSENFHLKIYVDMVNTDAFHDDVIAYPAITIIERAKAGSTRIAHRPEITARAFARLSTELLSSHTPKKGTGVRELEGVVAGSEPWILESSDQLALMRRLEATFPLIEETGCKVGIGVATGADKVFIAPFEALDIEPDRKLPLVMTGDILKGVVEWQGLGVVNPFSEDGSLVDLEKFPRLQRYLERHKDQIARRHVARRMPSNWYRTIDRIYPSLAKTPKLVIPDIKGEAQIVYEEGRLYPHHNLYFITSEHWDLKALQAVLLSGIARLFVSIYSTKMRGGYFRFQAQYLRRIRLPHWNAVAPAVRQHLVSAAERHDVAACNRAVFALYGLNKEEKAALGGNGD
jgi:hypothetical protein